jgi:hypothetical protein
MSQKTHQETNCLAKLRESLSDYNGFICPDCFGHRKACNDYSQGISQVKLVMLTSQDSYEHDCVKDLEKRFQNIQEVIEM